MILLIGLTKISKLLLILTNTNSESTDNTCTDIKDITSTYN